jgi:hypothetical protein
VLRLMVRHIERGGVTGAGCGVTPLFCARSTSTCLFLSAFWRLALALFFELLSLMFILR